MTTPNTAKGQSSADRLADAAEALNNYLYRSGLIFGIADEKYEPFMQALAAYLKEKERPIETPSLLASKTADSSEITDTQRLDWIIKREACVLECLEEGANEAERYEVYMEAMPAPVARGATPHEALDKAMRADAALTPPPTGDGASQTYPEIKDNLS